MMLSFGVAKELGYTVQELHERITPEELLGGVVISASSTGARRCYEESPAAAIEFI